MLNTFYDHLWLYNNLFQPGLHMVSKQVFDGKLHRKWDTAKTHYQRLLESNILSREQKTRLAVLYEKTNPRELRTTIYRTIEMLGNTTTTIVNSERKEEPVLSR
jgi:hypothetical protein